MSRKAVAGLSISALFFLPSVICGGEVEAFGGKILARLARSFLLPSVQTFVLSARSLILGTLNHSFYPLSYTS
jgi:hypothetical protein